MYKLLLTITLSAIFSTPSFSIAEKARDTSCSPRVPVIEHAEAIDIAVKTTGSNIKKIFIDGTQLICENNIHYWVVTFRKRETETGQMIVKVYMDKQTHTSFLKDG